MRDSACEASVALSSYVAIVGGHSALTSECGSMLEEVSSVCIVLYTGIFSSSILPLTSYFVRLAQI